MRRSQISVAVVPSFATSIAQDELKTYDRAEGGGGGRLMTPEDEQNARIREQKYLDLLDAKLEALKAQVSLLCQTGQFSAWLQSLARCTRNTE